jgi:hypothetical protein
VSLQAALDAAREHGIEVSFTAGELILRGDVNDAFAAWAQQHRDEIAATLGVRPSICPWPTRIDALVSSACYGTGYTDDQARELLADDLADLEAGTLTLAAAKHYLQVCWAEGVRPGEKPLSADTEELTWTFEFRAGIAAACGGIPIESWLGGSGGRW